jgi:regulator of protease activity HflC (stomatin/prohibitin superfamily)
MLGQKKGVDYDVLTPGRYPVGINVEYYTFPTFTQNYVWTADITEGSPTDESITFQTKEGMSVNADVGITYHINPQKVGNIFEKYKKGIDEITDVFLRNMVRDAFVNAGSVREVESVYGMGKSELVNDVEVIVKKQTDSIGIIVDKIYLVGELRLPRAVYDALNEKVKATQKAQQRENELRQTEAEARKMKANAEGMADSIRLVAEAQAQANKLLNSTLTPTLVNYKAIEKWNGALPQVSGSNTPFINLK